MTHKDPPKFLVGRPPRHLLGRACISHVKTPFFLKVEELGDTEPEWIRAEAQRILGEVSSWYGRIEQLVRSAHECGTASTSQEARERFNAINEQRLGDFLLSRSERTETLLWDGVYAQLILKDFGPNHLTKLFEGIRALDLLQIVESLDERSRPPSWYKHCDLPISHPRTFGPKHPAHERRVSESDPPHQRETVRPVSGIRALVPDDLSTIEKTLQALERKLK